uniref:Uncharacterized protein n=1 Tax=Ditylenchus dipsaci TaxID=166011 RepID=A0A915D4Z4_9BILA
MEGKTMRHNAIALVDAAEELLCVEYENTFSDKLAEFKKLLVEAKTGDNNELEKLPSTLSVQVLKQPTAKPSFVDPPTNTKKLQMGRRGKKKRGRASAIPLNTNMTNILPDNKRRRTAPASLLHLSKSSIVKKYNKLQKNSSLRSSQKSEDEDMDLNRQLSRKNSPPMLEESTQDSLPVPELVAEYCVATTPTSISNPFGQADTKAGQSVSGSQRKEVKIDERFLKIVLNQCVEKTYNWSIPDMESLGAVLTQAIEEFADQWDRRTLPERLEQVLRSYAL